MVRRQAAVAALLLLAGCAAQPTPADIALMQNAPAPSSAEAAQEAVKRYFAESLFDAPAARYRFRLAPVRGFWSVLSHKHAGWFLCGEINGKNRVGGYTGWETFFTYFSPTVRDSVIDGAIDDSASHVVLKWCEDLYKGHSASGGQPRLALTSRASLPMFRRSPGTRS